MLHKAWNSKGEMPYRFPRSSVKFQGHTVQNITEIDPNWAFPDYRPVAAFKSLRFALLPHSATLKLLPQQVSSPVPGSGTKHVRDNQPDTSKIAEICGRVMFHQDRDAILGKTFLSTSEINNRFHKVSQIQIQIQNL